MSGARVTSPLSAMASMDSDLARVETCISQSVQSADPQLTEMASHLVTAGGKRLRPMVAVAAAQVTGSPASDDVVRGGVACELVHMGSLYHDDVIDEADTRRGVQTVNARWDNVRAVLAGDFLLAKASEIAASLGTEVSALLARTIGWLCEGEVEQLRHMYNPDRPEDSYLLSIQGKTASLFATAARIGAIVAGHDRPLIEALSDYGRAYGMVFQIIDDVLDLTATDAVLGKPAGHDIDEGVYTLPVLRTLAAGGPAAAELRSALGQRVDDDERERALDIVRRGEGVQSALTTARRFAGEADAASADFPPGPVTETLRAAPQALIDSIHDRA